MAASRSPRRRGLVWAFLLFLFAAAPAAFVLYRKRAAEQRFESARAMLQSREYVGLRTDGLWGLGEVLAPFEDVDSPVGEPERAAARTRIAEIRTGPAARHRADEDKPFTLGRIGRSAREVPSLESNVAMGAFFYFEDRCRAVGRLDDEATIRAVEDVLGLVNVLQSGHMLEVLAGLRGLRELEEALAASLGADNDQRASAKSSARILALIDGIDPANAMHRAVKREAGFQLQLFDTTFDLSLLSDDPDTEYGLFGELLSLQILDRAKVLELVRERVVASGLPSASERRTAAAEVDARTERAANSWSVLAGAFSTGLSSSMVAVEEAEGVWERIRTVFDPPIAPR